MQQRERELSRIREELMLLPINERLSALTCSIMQQNLTAGDPARPLIAVAKVVLVLANGLGVENRRRLALELRACAEDLEQPVRPATDDLHLIH
jgi:hypothetical protein